MSVHIPIKKSSVMSKLWGHINITQNRKQKFKWFGLIVKIDTLSESKKYDKMFPQC